MEEPSVLDYVKAKLTFWKPSTLEIPAVESDRTQEILAAGSGVAESLEAVARPRRIGVTYRLPWLPLATLGFALIAQTLLEPPNRLPREAAILYLVAAVIAVFGYVRGDVQPGLPSASEAAPDSLQFRREGLIVAGLLLLSAFFFFRPAVGEPHRFNFLNTTLWLVGLGYLIWACMRPLHVAWRGLSQQVRAFVMRPAWKVSVSRWALVLLIAAAVVLFFRFYRLEGLPGEMVSDHAEKLLDVNDVLNGDYNVFFPRNTGREAFQFYWTALMSIVFKTGISFMSLKIGTVLTGLVTVFYMYRLGSLVGNRWVGLYVLLFAGFGYWPNIISRIGLRFPLYPFFFAPLLFYLVRGLRDANRNDFIKAGLWLGAGLHGYTSYRIVPFLVVVAFLLYLLHEQSPEIRKRILLGFVVLVVISAAVFLPLGRFAVDQWDMFALRSMTRLGEAERPLPGPVHEIFLGNVWNAITMFFWQDGDVWVHSVPGRPAMDIISAGLFFIGLTLVVARYARHRHWLDLFLLISIPVLLLPSILSLAFPNENPNLNRTAAAYVPAFLILGIGLDALVKGIRANLPDRVGAMLATVVAGLLLFYSARANYDLVFNQYDRLFRQSAWNTSEMGAVIRAFDESVGNGETNAWTLAFPYWVDTRLVAINAGYPTRDSAISPDQLAQTEPSTGAKLFLVNPTDVEGLAALRHLYPQGRSSLHDSPVEGKDFIVFLVPPSEDHLPVAPIPAP